MSIAPVDTVRLAPAPIEKEPGRLTYCRASLGETINRSKMAIGLSPLEGFASSRPLHPPAPGGGVLTRASGSIGHKRQVAPTRILRDEIKMSADT
jgi:hypothetical protein